MKITRFGQSCALIETKGKRILIDPGNLLLDDSILKEYWIDIDIILVTHKHGDHCDENSIKEIMINPKTKFYSSSEVANAFPELSPEIVKEGDVKEINGIKVEVVKAVHGYITTLKGGKEINENIGYIIDDNEKRAYFTSDTISFKNDYKCDVVFVPVCNHGLVMGAYEAALFAKETGASLVILNHYDNPKYPTDLEVVANEFKKLKLNYNILEIKQSINT